MNRCHGNCLCLADAGLTVPYHACCRLGWRQESGTFPALEVLYSEPTGRELGDDPWGSLACFSDLKLVPVPILLFSFVVRLV